ncbi:TPA: nitronate monooxygenase [Klebsiella pneumoniae]
MAPEMSVAVSNAGALGSISVRASTSAKAESLIKNTRKLTTGLFNVNVFCHARGERNEALKTAWFERFLDVFEH